MAEAILSRLLALGIYPPERVLVSEPQAQRRTFLAEQYGVGVTDDNAAVVARSAVVLLAIKPQVFEAIAPVLAQGASEQLVISILAGVPLARLEAACPGRSVIRAMPNTPATVGAGITAIAPGQHSQPTHLELAHRLFAAVGEVVDVPEPLMDAVTGLSGSGPAYVALLIEALADGGVWAGLPRATALKLAVQTVRGTAELLQTTGMHPAELKDRVSSPGGTTIAGVAQLEQAAFRAALMNAVQAACRRSQELGHQ